MPYNDDSHHVVKTSAQWDERAIEFWVVPRGCLCVELTPDGKTKIKIGEGNKFYSQLPYITSEGDLSNYYTKTEIDSLLTNLNRMAIQSTEEYDSKNDLPLTGNKLGDVRFVKSASPSIKTDPDVYVWDNTKWIYVGYDFSQIDLSEYVKKEEFEPVKEKVDEMYPLRHTHTNKEILDQIEVAFKVVDKNKLDSLENYDDTEVKNRLTNVENKAHVHNNMQILNATTAAFTIPDKNKLDSLRNYDVFRGTNGIIPGTVGLVPAPQPVDVGKVLGADGRWVDVAPFTGASATTDGESGLVPAPLAGEQSYYLRGDGTWAKVKTGDKYRAGDGIYILAGEAISDTYPFKIYSRSAYLTQYIIYGTDAGVGEWDAGQNKFVINLSITADGEIPMVQQILLDNKLYAGDYIDFERQIIVTSKQDMKDYVTLYNHPSYGTSGTYQWRDGSIGGNYYYNPGVTNNIAVTPGDRYWIKAFPDEYIYADNSYHCIFNANDQVTRYFAAKGAGPMIIEIQPGETYARFVGKPSWNMVQPGFLYKLEQSQESTVLPRISLFPDKINTVNVTNTNKPSQIYVKAYSDEPEDPDDPTSFFTGMIYNEGVLDITQEDPNALNELTVHFRESDKVITIPAGGSTYTAGDGIDIDANDEISAKLGSGLRFDANGAIEVTGGGGGSYTPGNGINITNDKISVKIGDGLSFDNNDAITVDEMTGATALANGASGTVPAPLAGDDAKFLRGDGSWAEIEASTKYVEGDAIEFGHPGMTDLGFDFDTFVSKFTEPNNGTVSIDSTNKAFTLTATGSDCYTSPWSGGSLYTIPVIGGRKYRLTWDSNAPNVSGSIYAFENADTSHMHSVNQAVQNYLEFTADTNSNINFRFGVRNAGDSITYSNIKFYEVDNGDPDTNIINVKYGNGLSLDNNNTLQVDGMVGATSLTAGRGGTVPAPSAGDENKFLSGSGIWSNPPTYTLPVATTSTLGGVKVGAGLSMNANDELGVTSPYVTSVANQGSVPGVITVTKSDGISTDVDILENLRLILNCNYDSSQNQTQLGEPVNAPNAGNSIGSSIIGDLTVLEVT